MSRTFHHSYWWRDEFESTPRKTIKGTPRFTKLKASTLSKPSQVIDALCQQIMKKLQTHTPQKILEELDTKNELIKQLIKHNGELTELYLGAVPDVLLIGYTPQRPLSNKDIAVMKNKLYATHVLPYSRTAIDTESESRI